MLQTIYERVGTAIWLAACLPAFWLGGRPERIFALVLLLDLASVELAPQLNPIHGVQWWTATGDLGVLAALVWLMRRYPRRWLPVAGGFQAVSILGHVPRMIDPTIRNWSYLTLTVGCGYAVLGCLIWGVITEQRRAK